MYIKRKLYIISICCLIMLTLMQLTTFEVVQSLYEIIKQNSAQLVLLILFLIFCYGYNLYHVRLIRRLKLDLYDIGYRLDELSESFYCECGHSEDSLQTIHFLKDSSIKKHEDEEFAKVWGLLNKVDIALTLKSCKECQKVTIKQSSK